MYRAGIRDSSRVTSCSHVVTKPPMRDIMGTEETFCHMDFHGLKEIDTSYRLAFSDAIVCRLCLRKDAVFAWTTASTSFQDTMIMRRVRCNRFSKAGAGRVAEQGIGSRMPGIAFDSPGVSA